MNITVWPNSLADTVFVPPSKSIAIRAAACAALAGGQLHADTEPLCDDIAAARGAAAAVQRAMKYKSQGRRSAMRVSCGESALCYRMFGAACALLDLPIELHAEGSLAARPFGMDEAVLTQAAKQLIREGSVWIDASLTSQILSGLLIAIPALPLASHAVYRIAAGNLASPGYADMTLALMRMFGAAVDKPERCGDSTVFTVFAMPYSRRDYSLHECEGDWSAAAYMLAAAALRRAQHRVQNLAPNSCQPDRVFETLVSLNSALKAFSFDAADTPDLFPPLAVLALGCEGVSRIYGVNRLIYKESNRGQALVEELCALGFRLCIEGDALVIHGGFGRPSSGAPYTASSRGDHRIAMALAIAAESGLIRPNGTDPVPLTIQNAECVHKSWPRFFDSFTSSSEAHEAF